MEQMKVVATKVRASIGGLFERICARLRTTSYTALQNFIDVFIRMCSDKHNLTPENEMLMASFEGTEGWENSFNLADPTTDPEISEATYYLRDKDKKGVRVVHVERPFFGHWTQTYNVKQILEKFLCLTFPQLYRRLRFMAVCRDCQSILELLYSVVTELEAEEDKAELRKPFEDAERSEWGKRPNDARYKIHHRKTVDDMPSPTLFDDDDQDTFLNNENEE